MRKVHMFGMCACRIVGLQRVSTIVVIAELFRRRLAVVRCGRSRIWWCLCSSLESKSDWCCPVWHWTLTLCLLVVSPLQPLQCLARVFACMSDGLVAVYTLLEDLPVDGEIYLCSHTMNKTVFGLRDSDPRQRPYPIRTMVLVSGGSQVSRK